ncbi:hypothetical protein J5Y09_23285, partial [Roseomonas sp. PWR1]
PLPRRVAQHQTIQDAQGQLPKGSLESRHAAFGNPKSPHDLEQYPTNRKRLIGFLALENIDSTARNPITLKECDRIVL